MADVERTRTGLVLEGGALRGLFTSGVLDVMLEHGVTFDGMIGVSAGAAFGCNFKSRQIGRVVRYNKKYCRDRRYCSLYSLLTTGDLFGGDFCYCKIPMELDKFDVEEFKRNPIKFYMVCTDIETGEPEYVSADEADEKCFTMMRASASMPLVSNVVEFNGRRYLDGAIGDSIPLKYFESIGYDRNVVVLTQIKGFVKKPTPFMLPFRITYRRHKKFLAAFERRYELYNETVKYVEEREKAGKVFVIRPEEPLPIKRLCRKPELLQETYEKGRERMTKLVPALKEFLSLK